MSNHTRTFVQRVAADIDRVWEFFSVPANLAAVTPPGMNFRVSDGDAARQVHEGMHLAITVTPLLLIPVSWTMEIVKVEAPCCFEDRQLDGPYESWYHRHLFREIDGGTELTDIIEYRLPMGFFGELADTLFVARQLDGMFAERRRRVGDIFGLMA
jgi:ligand-binding SRPBCC domain-containing protein